MATMLNNEVLINGQYDDIPFEPLASNTTLSIIDVSVVKTADKAVWTGGDLTYTVSIINNDADLPLTNLVLTDTLDPLLVAFTEGSVEINGTPAAAEDVSYDAISGLLTVQVPDVAAGATTDITFQVTQK